MSVEWRRVTVEKSSKPSIKLYNNIPLTPGQIAIWEAVIIWYILNSKDDSIMKDEFPKYFGHSLEEYRTRFITSLLCFVISIERSIVTWEQRGGNYVHECPFRLREIIYGAMRENYPSVYDGVLAETRKRLSYLTARETLDLGNLDRFLTAGNFNRLRVIT